MAAAAGERNLVPRSSNNGYVTPSSSTQVSPSSFLGLCVRMSDGTPQTRVIINGVELSQAAGGAALGAAVGGAVVMQDTGSPCRNGPGVEGLDLSSPADVSKNPLDPPSYPLSAMWMRSAKQLCAMAQNDDDAFAPRPAAWKDDPWAPNSQKMRNLRADNNFVAGDDNAREVHGVEFKFFEWRGPEDHWDSWVLADPDKWLVPEDDSIMISDDEPVMSQAPGHTDFESDYSPEQLTSAGGMSTKLLKPKQTSVFKDTEGSKVKCALKFTSQTTVTKGRKGHGSSSAGEILYRSKARAGWRKFHQRCKGTNPVHVTSVWPSLLFTKLAADARVKASESKIAW